MSIWLTNFKTEAALIGGILTRYGDLEYDWVSCLAVAIKNPDTAFRCLFRLRGGSVRTQVGDALMRPYYEAAGLKDHYETTLGAFRYATTIRNQFAHATFYDSKTAGLFFTDMEKAAKTATGNLMFEMRHIDIPILEKHKSYMDYAADCLAYLEHEALKRAGEQSSHIYQVPKVVERPLLHNPIEEHPLPSEARASEQPPATPGAVAGE